MTRIFAVMVVVLSCLLASAVSGWSAGPVLVQGQVTDIQGRPVVGAEIKLSDRTGTLRYHTLSDSKGQYRFQALLPVTPQTSPFKATISHVRYRPVSVDDVAAQGEVTLPTVKDISPAQSLALLPQTTVLSLDFRLTPLLHSYDSLCSCVPERMTYAHPTQKPAA